MAKKIAIIRGDGTGPELIDSALQVLEATEVKVDLTFCDAGYEWWEMNGGDTLIPPDSWKILEQSDACLKGPTITPTVPGTPRSVAVSIRQKFELFANVRPIKTMSDRGNGKAVDFLCVREGTEGMYSGIGYSIDNNTAISVRMTTRRACERVSELAFRLAKERSWKSVVAIHKANILRETDSLFLEVVKGVSQRYPGIELKEYFVDNIAQQLVKNPERFNHNVLLSTNLFMDIISEEASGLVGSIGNIYSANFGDQYAMFEPAHGSSPKYKGMNKVNPTATILSVAWMLNHLGETTSGNVIFRATEAIIRAGKDVTYDLGGSVGTREMATAISRQIKTILN